MSPVSPTRVALWSVILAVAIGALMVLPAGAMLPSNAGTRSAPVSGTATTPSAAVGTTASAPLEKPSTSASTVTPTIPSAAPATSNAISVDIQKLEANGAHPSMVAMLQRIATDVQSGAINPRDLILPNINALLGDAASPTAAISQQYYQSPAPMGIADFGLGATPYEYNTSSFLGTTNLTSYNATAGSLYEPSGQYYWWGNPADEPGTPYDSGIQLNTILANVTFPGSAADPLGSGVFWTQNVPNFDGNSIQLLDNVWNDSAPDATMNPGTLYSYDGALVPYVYYYCVGPTLPAVYPLSLQLYNNASVIHGRSAVSYGYRLVDGNGKVYTGTYDTVIFNSPRPVTIKPQFRVDGFALTPYESVASFDAELVFCGPADGSNAIITNLSGSMTLQYLPTGSHTWTSVPSAYDHGTDTGETAIGLSAYWTGRTVHLDQGPSLLYGLWNTPSSVGVPSGAIHFTGHSSPNYAFTFIGETVKGAPAYQEYAPSNSLGVVDTYLPPSIPGSTGYSVAAYADEYADFTGSTFHSSDTHYAIAMTRSPGSLDAPLYMNGEAQATALVTAIDGSATVPYTFRNLVVHLGLPFNLLNDWGFTTFNLFFATGVTSPIVVDNVAQGPNSGTQTLYFYPSPGFVANFTGAACPDGYCYFDLPNASQEFVDYGGVGDLFTHLSLPGFFGISGVPLGGAVVLWGTRNVLATDLTVTNYSYGVWASAATDTEVTNSVATNVAEDFSVIASAGAVGSDDSAYDSSTAVVDYGGFGGTFSSLGAFQASYAFDGLWANATSFDRVTAQGGSDGVAEQLGYGLRAADVWAGGDSQGVVAYGVQGLTADVVGASGGSTGVYLDGLSGATVSQALAERHSTGVYVNDSSKVTVSRVWATEHSIGVYINESSQVTVSWVFAWDHSVGVYIVDSSKVSVSNVFAWDHSVGVVVQFTPRVTVSRALVRGSSVRG